MKELLWWGFLHVNGEILLKRYYNQDDIYEAEDSGFVVDIFGPFEAPNRDKAMELLTEKLT